MTSDAGAEESVSAERYRRRRRFGRRCALQFLYQGDQQGDWDFDESGEALFRDQVLEMEDCLPADEFERAWPFAVELIRGVLANRGDIDSAISGAALNWTLPRMAAVDRNILRLAAYELRFDTDTPAVAAVDEAIELAKTFGHQDSHRFVNGILDRLLHDLRPDAEMRGR